VTDRPIAAPSGRALTVFAMDPGHLPGLFPADLIRRLGDLARLDPALCVEDFADARHAGNLLAETEVLITGWGCPPIDEAALARMPTSCARCCTRPGSVRSLITEAAWERGPAGDERGGGQRAAGGRVHPRRRDLRGQKHLRRPRPLPRRARYPAAAQTAA
jgi:hypothetical protein